MPAGANAGWPCFEGNHVQSGFSNKPPCTTLAAGSVQMPLIEWDHSGGDTAVVSGTFYTGTAFPAEYQGAYFYGDYSRGWIKRARVTANDTVAPGGGPTDFATGLAGPVQIETGPDGAIYYVTIGSGELRRIRFFSDYAPIECPSGQYRAEYFNNKTLNGVPAVQRCETTINYDWGSGAPVSGVPADGFSARWTGRFALSNFQ